MNVSNRIDLLLIEDDASLPSGLADSLAAHGFQVDVKQSIEEGWYCFRSQQHQVVVVEDETDIGAQALRVFRDAAPVIIVGSEQKMPQAFSLIKQGAADYVCDERPDLVPRLVKLIEQVHQQHNLYNSSGHSNGHLEGQSIAMLEKRTRGLLQLNEASQQFSSTLQPNQVMAQLLAAATKIVGAKDASVWAWENDDQRHLICQATSNNDLWLDLQRQRLRSGEGIAGWVSATGESTVVNDTRHDSRFTAAIDAQTGFNTQSLLAVPLIAGDHVIGVLEILNKNSGVFDDEDMMLAEMLASSSAVALENARLVEKLQAQKGQLQARNDELDAFAHTVAHDLKTPLNWVSGYVELLLKDYDRLDDETRLEYVRALLNGARMMNNIIDDLLLLASLRWSEVAHEPIDMATVLRRARQRLAPMIEEYDADLQTPPDFPTVMGYAPWVEGVWVNYISNAIKYGGEPPQVQLGFHENGGEQIVFWVEDNGAGLTDDQRSQLFIPFSRPTQSRAQGHGLGLSIVRRIVEKLGGEVGIDSIPGDGSRFYFTLPRANGIAH